MGTRLEMGSERAGGEWRMDRRGEIVKEGAGVVESDGGGGRGGQTR